MKIKLIDREFPRLGLVGSKGGKDTIKNEMKGEVERLKTNSRTNLRNMTQSLGHPSYAQLDVCC